MGQDGTRLLAVSFMLHGVHMAAGLQCRLYDAAAPCCRLDRSALLNAKNRPGPDRPQPDCRSQPVGPQPKAEAEWGYEGPRDLP